MEEGEEEGEGGREGREGGEEEGEGGREEEEFLPSSTHT